MIKRKIMSVILCAAMVFSLCPALSSAKAGVTASVFGTREGTVAAFTVILENDGEEDSEVSVFTAVYNADGSMESAKKYDVTAAASSRIANKYEVDFGSGEAKIYVWDKNNKPVTEAFSSNDCIETDGAQSARISIGADDVWASAEPEAANTAKMTVDGDLATIWTSQTAESAPQYLTAYLGGTYEVTKVGVALDLATEREYVFSVSLSYDGESFVEVVHKRITDKTDDIQYFDTARLTARYMRVTLYGRADQSGALAWSRLSEIEAYGTEAGGVGEVFSDDFSSLSAWSISPMDELSYTDYTPALGNEIYAEAAEMPESGKGAMRLYDNADRSGETEGGALTVLSAEASQAPEAANVPANVLDGDDSTIWTASGVTDGAPAYLTIKLDKLYQLTKVGIAFGKADQARTYVVSVALSENGSAYTTAADRVSVTQAANSTAMQYIEFMQTEAVYVRFTFYARTDSSNNGWIRVAETEVCGTEDGIDGAGGILAQHRFTPPANRADYTIDFDMYMPSDIGGGSASSFYSGISLTDGIITGGADLDNYSAIQLRFDNSDGKVKVNTINSNYFNETTPIELFENTFLRDSLWHVKMQVSPLSRRAYITISDGETEETELLYFAYCDKELTRNSAWSGLEVNTLVFNTGASAKCEMYVSDVSIKETEDFSGTDPSEAPVNGIIRLEEVRLSDDPTTSAFYGKYIYHSGADAILAVEAEKNPALTRFVERKGLIGVGVSLEAVSLPGYFAVCDNGGIYLKKLENNGVFYANATFIKTAEENIGYYTGKTYSYKTYLNRDKYIYDTTARYEMHGDLKPWSMYNAANAVFYLRSEATAYVSDNFYGDSIGSQWWTNFPWKSNHPTNDSYNFSALITEKNVIVENGELFLKATKVSGWPTDVNKSDGGDGTGINYNGSYGKKWVRWQGYVGVVSIQNKVYNKQCYIEGSFKQPDSPIGYWNAFWLNGRDSWPPEIDIFEFLSSTYGHKAWNTALHYNTTNSSILGKQTSATDLTSGYHTFALDWGYDYMKFYLDGKIYTRVQPSNTANTTALNYQKNLRLILNTGIGGWEAEPDDTMVWNDGLRCKYIRSFQY